MVKLAPLIIMCCALSFQLADGQGVIPQTPLRIDQAVELADSNFPSIRVAQTQREATRRNIGLAQTLYLPRLDLLWQENRASVNNIFGTPLPQGVLESISGPVLGTKSFDSTFDSAGGALFSWEPFDFGYRKATVDVARDQTKQAEANVSVTMLMILPLTFAIIERHASRRTISVHPDDLYSSVEENKAVT